MKKFSIILLFLFIVLTVMIISCPVVTIWDRSIIVFIQKILSFIPIVIPMLPDCMLYCIMVFIPLIGFSIFFIKKRLYYKFLFFVSIPIITFLINCIIKLLIKRPRPPLELQISSIHPDSFSYVSSHSLVTICLWGMVIICLCKFCKNLMLRNAGIFISVIWIIFVGLSRIWLGVHNPSDVLGAYLLGLSLLMFYAVMFFKL